VPVQRYSHFYLWLSYSFPGHGGPIVYYSSWQTTVALCIMAATSDNFKLNVLYKSVSF
jgi:hypothetical protein